MDPKITILISSLVAGRMIKEDVLIKLLKSDLTKNAKSPLAKFSDKKIKKILQQLVETNYLVSLKIKSTGSTVINSNGSSNENFFFGPPKGLYYLANSKESISKINEFLNLELFCIYK